MSLSTSRQYKTILFSHAVTIKQGKYIKNILKIEDIFKIIFSLFIFLHYIHIETSFLRTRERQIMFADGTVIREGTREDGFVYAAGVTFCRSVWGP